MYFSDADSVIQFARLCGAKCRRLAEPRAQLSQHSQLTTVAIRWNPIFAQNGSNPPLFFFLPSSEPSGLHRWMGIFGINKRAMILGLVRPSRPRLPRSSLALAFAAIILIFGGGIRLLFSHEARHFLGRFFGLHVGRLPSAERGIMGSGACRLAVAATEEGGR